MPDITSRKNSEIQRLRRLLENGAFRRAENVFVCHGEVALFEAIKSGAQIEKVFCLPEKIAELPKNLRIFTVTQDILDIASGVENSSGVVFTCALPQKKALSGRKLVLLCSVRDPGNVGTVIRTADAFSFDGVIFSGTCADPFAPKTVRSTMGSLFRVPIFFENAENVREYCKNVGIKLYAAALSDDAKSIKDVDLREGCVMIGNEAHGLSESELSLSDEKVIIPIKSAESLNAAVAAAVFMWEMSR